MMAASRRSRVICVLFGFGAILLTGELAWTFMSRDVSSPVIRADRHVAGTAPVAKQDMGALHDQWSRTALARPLFNVSRLPAAAPAGTQAAGVPRLMGVTITADGRSALFTVPGRLRALRVSVGQQVGPYRILTIETQTVRVKSGTEEMVLQIYPQRASHTATPTKTPSLSESENEAPRSLQPDQDPAHPVVIIPLPSSDDTP